MTPGSDPAVVAASLDRHRRAFRVGCTLVLSKPWDDFTPAEQVDALHRAHTSLEDEVLLKVPAAMLDVQPATALAGGVVVPTVEVTLVVPQPARLPSASRARMKWAAESPRGRR